MWDRDPITIRMQGEVIGTSLTLHTEPVRRGEVWTVDQVAVSTDNTEGCYATLYVDDGNRLTAVETITLTAADLWWAFEALPVTLLSDYRLAIEFAGLSAGDVVRANVHAYTRAPYTSP
jgi:hypothetical protein